MNRPHDRNEEKNCALGERRDAIGWSWRRAAGSCLFILLAPALLLVTGGLTGCQPDDQGVIPPRQPVQTPPSSEMSEDPGSPETVRPDQPVPQD